MPEVSSMNSLESITTAKANYKLPRLTYPNDASTATSSLALTKPPELNTP